MLPERLRQLVMSQSIVAPSAGSQIPVDIDLAKVRLAIRNKMKISFDYRDEAGRASSRTIWPLTLAFFGPVWNVLGWCEMREDFRAFRPDRMREVDFLEDLFPDTYEALLKLPGIGPYTAAAIASIAFDRAETVLDGNVERVMARLHDIHDPLPGSKELLREHAAALTPGTRPGDYAQAVMDLGATICTPKSPACGICPWRPPCTARIAGTAVELPKKTPKKPKPTRRGVVYLARSPSGTWLLERRPDKGLLGGMLGWPGSDWNESPLPNPPFEADWQDLGGEVRHTFTHFHLILRVHHAELPEDHPPEAHQELLPRHVFRPKDLPTVMRKAFDLWQKR